MVVLHYYITTAHPWEVSCSALDDILLFCDWYISRPFTTPCLMSVSISDNPSALSCNEVISLSYLKHCTMFIITAHPLKDKIVQKV